MRITGGGFEISVDVTFKGTWNRVIAKRREAVVGRITEARTANCRVTRPAGATCEVEIRVEPRMPISKLYAGFTGTLPNIGGIKTDQSMPVDVTISNPSPVSCLYAGEVGVGEFGNPIEGEMITESGLSFVSGEMTCSTSPLFLAGAAAAEPRQTITLL